MPQMEPSCHFLQICDSFCTGDRNYNGITLEGNLAAIKICARQPPALTTPGPTTTSGPIIVFLD